MPRSTTIWAAALLLASLSGPGSVLTTAEAMPAPGPQETTGRPRYYFPRHVKRMIVTNSTAPASSTTSPESSSSTADSESKRPDLSSFFESFFIPPVLSSSSVVVSSNDEPASTTTVITGVTLIPVPVVSSSVPPAGTGDLSSEPVPSPTSKIVDPSASTVLPATTQKPDPQSSDVIASVPAESGSTGGIPSVIVQPSSSVVVVSSEGPAQITDVPPVASTGGLPSSIVPPTDLPIAGSTGTIPSSIVLPTDSFFIGSTSTLPPIAQSTDLPEIGSTGVLPSSIVLPTDVPVLGSTGVLPSSVVQPTDLPVVGTTGGVPASIVSPTASAPLAEEPSTVGSVILGPFIIPSSTGGLPVSIVQPSESLDVSVPTPTALEPSLSSDLPVGSTGEVPSGPVVLPTSDPVLSTDVPPVSQPTSGIVVGITTAFGTTQPDLPTATGALPIPTSETASQSDALPVLSSLLPSLVSELPTILLPSEPILSTGVAPSITIGPTAPGITTDPLPTSFSELSSDLSAITSGLSSGVIPTDTVLLPPLPSSSLGSSIESSIPTAVSTLVPGTSSGILPPIISSGLPTGTGVTSAPPDVTTAPTSGIPTSEDTISTGSSSQIPEATGITSSDPLPTGTGLTSSNPLPSETGVTSSGVPTFTGTGVTTSELPSPSDSVIPTSEISTESDVTTQSPIPTNAPETSSSIASVIPTPTESTSFIPPAITSKPAKSTPPPFSILPTATDSETTYIVGTSIIQEASTVRQPTPTATGISSDLPVMIAPPDGRKARPENTFLGQIGFKWPLNYPFVCANDGGNQIFEFLPIAIADALNISLSEVVMTGLKPFDTTEQQGYITTMAVFYIPADLNTTLAAQLHSPPDPFWHNKLETVNQLTSLINTAFPLGAGRTSDDNSSPSGELLPIPTTDTQGGGAMGGDMGASRKINPTSVGIATGAIMGAIAYGAAMFFVARRYRNKKMGHTRSASAPSPSRFTYGSMTGGGAWMSGARGPGPSTPGGRESRGSDSSNDRSVRTQQISAPVMAENSLGWN